jgi:hypothetical protein
MATTTNYGWGTPDDTDLVKDGALAIRDLGQDIDTTTKALNPETTTGDIAYRSATANTNTRLALGTAGQVLTVNSGATAPEWASPAGGGKVLQVVMATNTTAINIQSTSYTNTNLSGTITPSSATSKILVLVSQPFTTNRDAAEAPQGSILLERTGSVSVLEYVNLSWLRVNTATDVSYRAIVSMSYLDTPATTSAQTYITRAKLDTTANSASIRFQQNSNTSQMILMEIGA